jgi:hypothetical protein
MVVIGDDSQRLSETHIGDQQPFAARPLRNRILAMPFDVPPPATRTERLEDEFLGMGIYFGSILAIMVYNLLIYLVTRDPISCVTRPIWPYLRSGSSVSEAMVTPICGPSRHASIIC